MTRKEFVGIVGPLALQFRQELDAAQWRLLHEALDDIPVGVLQGAVTRAVKTRQWFPKVAELREDAEACRLELRAALKFEPCDECSADGWVERAIAGVKRMVRCDCWKAHQARVAACGAPAQVLALPSGRRSDFTQVGEQE